MAEWLRDPNVAEALKDGEKLCVGVAEPRGERDTEGLPDHLLL